MQADAIAHPAVGVAVLQGEGPCAACSRSIIRASQTAAAQVASTACAPSAAQRPCQLPS